MSAKSDAQAEQVGLGIAAGVAVLAALAGTVASAGAGAPAAVPAAIGAVGAAASTGAQAYQAGKAVDTASKADDYKKRAQLQAAPAKSVNPNLVGGNTPAPGSPKNSSALSAYEKNSKPGGGGESPIGQIGLSSMMPAVGQSTPNPTLNTNPSAPGAPKVPESNTMENISKKMDQDMASNAKDQVEKDKIIKGATSAAQEGIARFANNLNNKSGVPIAPGAPGSIATASDTTPNFAGNAFNANPMPMAQANPMGPLKMNSPPPTAPLQFGQIAPNPTLGAPPPAPLSFGPQNPPPLAFSDINLKTDIRVGREEMNDILNKLYRKLVK